MPEAVLWALGAGVKAVWTTIGADPTYGWYLAASRLDGAAVRSITDERLRSSTADAARWAAFAMAGCPWQEHSDDAQRLRFWTWWLDDAVPAAWSSKLFAPPFADLEACLDAASMAREQLILVVEQLRARLESVQGLQQLVDEHPGLLEARLEQSRQDASDMVRLLKGLLMDVEAALVDD